LDVSTGLYYYGYRYLDGQSGRLMTVDPQSPVYVNPQTLNQYIYALDNPNRYSDPTGAVAKETITRAELKQQEEDEKEDAIDRQRCEKLLKKLNLYDLWAYTNNPTTTFFRAATTSATTTQWITTTPTTQITTITTTQQTTASTWGLTTTVSSVTTTTSTTGSTTQLYAGRVLANTAVNPQATELVYHIGYLGVEIVGEGNTPGETLDILLSPEWVCNRMMATGMPGCPDPTIY